MSGDCNCDTGLRSGGPDPMNWARNRLLYLESLRTTIPTGWVWFDFANGQRLFRGNGKGIPSDWIVSFIYDPRDAQTIDSMDLKAALARGTAKRLHWTETGVEEF